MYVDAHCHCHELPPDYLNKVVGKNELLIVCVSDDIDSSRYTIELSTKYGNLIPCIGIHPWSIGEASINDLKIIEKYINKHGIRCLGEIGLDTKFARETIDKQRVFFSKFIELAKEYSLVLNIHAAGTWSEVFELLVKNDVRRAYIHWYTGPKELIAKFLEVGYKIGVNPAWKIQKKHREIIEYAPLDVMITESDAPYKYRGLMMMPELVVETIDFISSTKQISRDTVLSTIRRNFQKIFL